MVSMCAVVGTQLLREYKVSIRGESALYSPQGLDCAPKLLSAYSAPV
jgi:hypothetical protein